MGRERRDDGDREHRQQDPAAHAAESSPNHKPLNTLNHCTYIRGMKPDISVRFTGLKFPNPFLLSSAPPTESDSNIMRAFEAGWGGVVTKTIGLHPVTNVAGPKTKFLRSTLDGQLSMQKRADTALHSSWNWELISDKTLDW